MSNVKKIVYGLLAGVAALIVASAVGLPQVANTGTKTLDSPLLQTTISVTKVTEHKKAVEQLVIPTSRAVFIFGPIFETAAYVSQIYAMDKKDSKAPIYVILDSPGGSILDGAKVINAIEGVTAPVNTVCVEMCASMAAMIHAYGATRYMTDRTLLMYHDYSGQFQGEGSHMHSLMSVVERYNLRMTAYIAQRAGVNLQDFIIGELRQIWIDSEDATDQHFNDKIVSFDVSSVFPKEKEANEKLKEAFKHATETYTELRNMQ
jgi:ATP-dependent Clp protease protease subunit